jgi:gas vesicle protein
MNNSRELAATLVGAVIGGVAGYLFFTDRGRSLRRQIEPALDDFSRELERPNDGAQGERRGQRRVETVERGARRDRTRAEVSGPSNLAVLRASIHVR